MPNTNENVETYQLVYDFDKWGIFYTIVDKIKEIESNFEGKCEKLTPSTISKMIRKMFDKSDFIAITERSDDVPADEIGVSVAYMDINTENGLPDFEVALMYNSKQKYYFSNVIDWEMLAYDLAVGVCREMISKAHNLNNDSVMLARAPSNEVFRYIGSDVEIKCSAFAIAAESELYGIDYEESDVFDMYASSFDPDSKVMLKLECEIMKNILGHRNYLDELTQRDFDEPLTIDTDDLSESEIKSLEELMDTINTLRSKINDSRKK